MSSFSNLTVEEPDDTDFCVKYLSSWSGYFKKSILERQKSVHNESNEVGVLPLDIADIMIENCIGTLSLPLGISPNFVINNKHFIVPYCVEEASVIAAASSISKLIAKNGGFITSNSERNIMIGQVQILNIYENIDKAINIIKQNESKYIKYGNNKYCLSMVKRGGGIINIETRIITPRIYKYNKNKRDKYLVIHIKMDVCDAMGANKVNTVCEGLSEYILNDMIYNGINTALIGLKILTNLCMERMTMSSFCIPINNLSWKGIDGIIVANKIINAYEFAMDDIFRATTNNKGIMNGMDAVSIALGQDWRAIECAVHCYASICNENNNQYGPLAHYYLDYSIKKKTQCLYGYLKIPISVGTKGGSITTHPGYKYIINTLLKHGFNDIDDIKKELTAKDIANIIVSAGLASNFAAIRALAIEGIQKGHMALHSKNIANSVLNHHDDNKQIGLIDEISQFIIKKKAINTNMANRYITARKIEFDGDFLMNEIEPKQKTEKKHLKVFPSTLMVEIASKDGMIELDVVINTALIMDNEETIHLEIKMDDKEQNKNNKKKGDKLSNEERLYYDDMILKLFGKSINDMVKEYNMMDSFNILCKKMELEQKNDDDMESKKHSLRSVLSEIKLLTFLVNILLNEYILKYEEKDNLEKSYINLIYKEMENYIILRYYNNDRSIFQQKQNKLISPFQVRNISNIKKKKLEKEMDGDLKLFSKCLIKSLLQSLIFRVKMIEKETSKNIGYCLLNWQLSSLFALKYIHELNEGFIKLNVSKKDNKTIGKCLNDVILQKGYKYPILIFLATNIMIQQKLNDLNEDFIKIIEKFGLFLQCNLDIHENIEQIESNTYLLYLKLFEINHSENNKESFYKLMNDKINKIEIDLQQIMTENEELERIFDLNELMKSLQILQHN